MPGKYTPQELEVILSGVNSGTPLSEIEDSLEGRTAVGIIQHILKLTQEDPNTWDPEKTRPYLGKMNSLLWKSAQKDPEKVQQSQQRVLDYLREKPDANRQDIFNVGLEYDFSVAYDGRINDARRDLGYPTRTSGTPKKFTKEQRKQRILSFLREHPNAQSNDNAYLGYSTDIALVEGSIDDLRREAGILPKGYIKAAEAARRLDKTREGVSYLFRENKLEGIRLGNRMYISETSVTNYSK